MIQQILTVWSLPFLNPAWTSGSFQFTYLWSFSWRIVSITLLANEMSAIVQEFEHSLVLPFFGIEMKTDLFQSCGHYGVFQICWHIECSTFTASSFRIWNSSTGIPSRPLALFVVMLPKAPLTSHSRVPDSRWVITPSWLSGSLKSFLYSSLVYSCHLFLLSSASVRSVLVLSFIVSIFAWNVYLRLFWSPFWDLNLQIQRPCLLSLYDSVHEMPTFGGKSLFLFYLSLYIFKWNF